MDFFDRQETAQRNTRWLLWYYPIAVLLIVASVYLVFALVWSRGALWNPTLFAAVALFGFVRGSIGVFGILWFLRPRDRPA